VTSWGVKAFLAWGLADHGGRYAWDGDLGRAHAVLDMKDLLATYTWAGFITVARYQFDIYLNSTWKITRTPMSWPFPLNPQNPISMATPNQHYSPGKGQQQKMRQSPKKSDNVISLDTPDQHNNPRKTRQQTTLHSPKKSDNLISLDNTHSCCTVDTANS